MKIEVAKTAGFCFGVKRAVDICEGLLDDGRSIATLGEIIHNGRVVGELRDRGCGVVERPADTPSGASLVIRSHGVPSSVFEECERLGIETIDATCPFVSKIHDIVREYGEKGYAVLIAGDENHPEVEGIVGHCPGSAYVFSDMESLKRILMEKTHDIPRIMVAQTTFNLVEYDEYKDFAKKTYTNLKVFDTICNATQARQREAMEMARRSDVCVVIGGKNSSNTRKLARVCEDFAETFCIEDPSELDPKMFIGCGTVGVTAGASTPSSLIEEVLINMSDIIRDEDFDFEKAIEDSCKQVHRGQRVEGIVTSIRPNEVVVDIGTKHTGFIPVDELSEDSSAKPENIVKVGDKLNLLVTKVQDLEGFVTLSKKRIDSEKGLEDIAAGVDDGTIFDAYITEAVNKGLVAIVKGVRVFIPASQATLRRGEPYEQLVHTHQQIKVLEVTPARRRAIGSIRAVLDIENEKKREDFWQTVEVGKKYTGTVKSLTSYGAFVDLGGVDGMVHVSELSWGRIKRPADVVSVGDVIDVYVKEVDAENKKISLGYRSEEDNPWNAIQNYPLGSEFEAPVVSITAFGAFVRILPGIDGLVHISEMSAEHVKSPGDFVKVGDVVKVRLIGVDLDKKRVSLSMKAQDGDENMSEEKKTAAQVVDELLDKAADVIETVKEKTAPAIKKAGEILDDVKEKSAPTVDKLKETANGLLDDVKEKSAPAVKKVKDMVSDFAEDVTEKAKDAAEKVEDAIDAARYEAADSMKDAFNKAMPLVDVAKDKAQDVVDSAKKAVSKAADAAKDVVDTVKDKFND